MKYTPGARRLSALHIAAQKKHVEQHVTPEGFEKLQKEHDDLLAERPDAIDHLKKSRELGDLSENGYYKASRAKVSFIDVRLRTLEALLKTVLIIDAPEKNIVSLGSKVVLMNGEEKKEYLLVGAYEANPREGKISNLSPVGKNLIGKKVGATIELFAPGGKQVYTLVKII